MLYITSDNHFNHRNIVEFCNRPFRTLDGHPDLPAMNQHMIRSWNSRVTNSDTVIHGGDFGMGSWKEWAGIRAQLNGQIVLVRGNHDRKLESWLRPGDVAVDYFYTRDGYFITHVPPHYGDHAGRYGELAVHPVPLEAHTILCGHVHNSWAETEVVLDGRKIKCYNIGVDVRGYVPLTIQEIVNG